MKDSGIPATAMLTRRMIKGTGYLSSNVKRLTNARTNRIRVDFVSPATTMPMELRRRTTRTRTGNGSLSTNVKATDAKTKRLLVEFAIFAKGMPISSSRRMRMGYGCIYTEPQSHAIVAEDNKC